MKVAFLFLFSQHRPESDQIVTELSFLPVPGTTNCLAPKIHNFLSWVHLHYSLYCFSLSIVHGNWCLHLPLNPCSASFLFIFFPETSRRSPSISLESKKKTCKKSVIPVMRQLCCLVLEFLGAWKGFQVPVCSLQKFHPHPPLLSATGVSCLTGVNIS